MLGGERGGPKPHQLLLFSSKVLRGDPALGNTPSQGRPPPHRPSGGNQFLAFFSLPLNTAT